MRHIHVNHGVITNMKRKALFVLIATLASIEMFVACSSDSDTGDSLVSVPANTSAIKGESFDFKASSCKEYLGKWSNGDGDEYIDFYMNDDGSATVNMEMSMICSGFVSMVYETRNDTLFATQNYTKITKALDSLTNDSVVVEISEFRSHCSCLADVELKIPSEFVGTKYVDFKGDCYSIVYKKRK